MNERLLALATKWRKSRAHTYASENADHYRGFDAGLARCADELEAAVRAGAALPPQSACCCANAYPATACMKCPTHGPSYFPPGEWPGSSALPLLGAWRDISTLPDDVEFIIAAWPCAGAESGFDVGEAIRDGKGASNWFNAFGNCEPTHWMPLPEAPNEGVK